MKQVSLSALRQDVIISRQVEAAIVICINHIREAVHPIAVHHIAINRLAVLLRAVQVTLVQVAVASRGKVGAEEYNKVFRFIWLVGVVLEMIFLLMIK